MNISEYNKIIQQEAAQCVKCGLCLPHCPTYVATQNEAESPRGRISLMAALANQQIALDQSTQTYLDHCLTCRACEAVCPAHVDYGQLIDNSRAAQNLQSNKKRLPLLLTWCLQHRFLLRIAAYLIAFYQKSGLAKLTRKIVFPHAQSFLPKINRIKPLKDFYPAIGNEKEKVALFVGCVASVIEQNTHLATIKLLNHLGYSVFVPKQQTCCGAIHQHAGFPQTAKKFFDKNLAVFSLSEVKTIITTASGCGAMLKEYALQDSSSQRFSAKVMDIHAFLLSTGLVDNIVLQPLAKRIVVHTPCTLRNVLKTAAAPYQLLEKIPQAQIISLTTKDCCGAAGLYFLQHPTMSEKLAETLLASINTVSPDIIVTSNIGCRLQIMKQLKEHYPQVKVFHPIELLAQQLIEK